ncbi:hypothetical protein [Bradyrhizobium paxllaeri]|uniref:hypothetical protein n=1 Tax=Bradyrhizobium paxllaeri TaxID=190148 RepID=UPI00114674AA|nr:hypothetical protein [Bradyrhizobium paxllaeri]
MLFVTPPYTLPKGTPKDEAKHLWTLQSSSAIDFASQRGCMESGRRIYLSVKPVANLAFRGLCLCESTQSGEICPVPPADNAAAAAQSQSSVPRDPGVSTSAFSIPLD